jgi:cobyrinic acid a,c-diamide synthase
MALRPGDDPTPYALGILAAARAQGLSVSVCTIGPDRDLPNQELRAQLAAASGHAVHRIDVDLMPVPSIQRVVSRAGAEVDFVVVMGFEAAVPEGSTHLPAFVHVQHALSASMVLCADVGSPVSTRVHGALEFFRERGMETETAVLLSGEGARLKVKAVEAATELRTMALERSARDQSLLELKGADLDELVEHAGCPSLDFLIPVGRTRSDARGRRARIGVVLDECFDFYDEEGLMQFELAGAHLVPLSAMGGGEERLELIDGLDGLIIGDGRIEKHSTALSQERRFRERLKAAIDAGLPTIASGGGLAYLTRGLRTISGALHPMLGVIDAEAVELHARPSFGHVEVQTLVDTLVGERGLCLRGFVQRSWLVRGVSPEERGIYATVSGPRDEGCGRRDLFATHFRPYWPSCPSAAGSFIDRCLRVGAIRERVQRDRAAEIEARDDASR